MNVSAQSSRPTVGRKVLWVYPDSGTFQPPPEVVTLQFGFSRKVKTPTATSLQSTVISSQAIYLLNENNDKITPNTVTINNNKDVITVTFRNLSPGDSSMDYTLVVDAAQFKDGTGSPFANSRRVESITYHICQGRTSHDGACLDD